MDDLIGSRQLLAWLADSVRHATRIDVASGFLSPGGLKDLLRTVGTGAPIRVLAGRLDTSDTAWTSLPAIRAAVVAFSGLELREVKQIPGMFHPKVVIVHREGTPLCYVGSANLTRSGLGANEEIGVVGSSWGTELAARFEDWWERGHPVGVVDWLSRIDLAKRLISITYGGGWRVEVHEMIKMARAEARLEGWRDGRRYDGQVLRASTHESLTIDVLDPAGPERVRAAASAARSSLRPISIATPDGGRYVPTSLMSEFYAWHVHHQAELHEATQRAIASLRTVDDLTRLVTRDAKQIFHLAHPPVDEAKFVEHLVETAREARTRFATSCPRPIDVYIDVQRYQLAHPEDLPPGSPDVLIASAQRRDTAWLISTLVSPRRSLRKYRNPERARALSIHGGADTRLEELCARWEQLGVPDRQGTLFGDVDGAAPPSEAMDAWVRSIDEEMAIINAWRSLRWEQVLRQAERWLGGRG